MRNVSCLSIGMGSGFAVLPDLLVTNRHVIRGARAIQVNTWDGRSLEADVAAVALASDIGFARVRGRLPEPARIAETEPSPGTDVTVVGYPGGGEMTFADGKIIDYTDGSEVPGFGRAMRISASVRQGNSGGPVLNEDGEVVGVVFAIERATGHGLAVPLSSLEEVVRSGDFHDIGPCV